MGMSAPSHSQEDVFAGPPETEGRRYYFDTSDGTSYVEDEEGVILKDDEAARVHAQAALADIARDVVPGDGPHRTMTCRVRDKVGKTVLKAALVLTVEMEP